MKKFRTKNAAKSELSNHFSEIFTCYKQKGYNIDVIKQSACLAVYPITVDHFAYLLNCTPVRRGADSMMARLKNYSLDGLGRTFYVCFSAHRRSTSGFLLHQYSSGVVWQPTDLRMSQHFVSLSYVLLIVMMCFIF